MSAAALASAPAVSDPSTAGAHLRTTRCEICVCCGKPLDPATGPIEKVMFFAHSRIVERGDREARLTKKQFALFEEMFSRFPRVLRIQEAWEVLFPDDDGVDRCVKNVHVQVSQLRKRLAPLGLDISRFDPLGYRLLRVKP